MVVQTEPSEMEYVDPQVIVIVAEPVLTQALSVPGNDDLTLKEIVSGVKELTKLKLLHGYDGAVSFYVADQAAPEV